MRPHRLPLAGIGAVAERPAAVTEDDIGVGMGTGKVQDFAQLRMEDPGIERQAVRGEPVESGAEFRPGIETGGRVTVADDRVRVPGARMPHPAKAPAAERDMRLQQRVEPVAQREVGKSHDPGGDPRPAIASALAHRRDSGNEFRLAERPQFLRSLGAVHRVTLHEDGLRDVVAGRQVGEEFVEQITIPVRVIPEVMMRVDDGKVRLQHRFRRRLRQPVLVRWRDPYNWGIVILLDHWSCPRRLMFDG